MGAAKGQRFGGRSKGTPNKVTQDVREAIIQAGEKLGGMDRLVDWAREDPQNERVFWSQIWTKVLPKEIKAEIDATLSAPRLEIVLNKK